MRRFSVLAAAGVVALVSIAAPAWSQEKIGHAGGFVIGAERLTGFATTHREADFEAGPITTELESNTTSFALLASQAESPFTTPRVGFDFFVIDGLSIGGLIGYTSWATEQELGSTEQEPMSSLFLFGFRAGYAYPFSDMLAIWPRGGVTFASTTAEDLAGNESDATAFALSAEVVLIVTPASHVAILVGPSIDYTVSGQGTYDPVTPGDDVDIEDLQVNTFGVHAGLAVWF